VLSGDKDEKDESKPKTNGQDATDRASSVESASEADDSEGGTTSKANGKAKDLRKLVITERQAARAKAKGAEKAAAELRRIEEEVAKIDRRLEAIERDFRRSVGVARIKPLGRDRFYNRVWWFDGLGSASLIGAGGTVFYGSGRLFVQGPSEFDIELMQRREQEEKDVESRRIVEEGKEGMLGVGEWAVYETVDEVCFV
jgi:bromodomain adjacent to zinc finger domain protein 1A